VTEPSYLSGMTLLIEDDRGEAEHLLIYNYITKSYDVDPNELSPKGPRIRIKEPYLRIWTSGNDEYIHSLVVDSPTEIEILSNNESDKSIEVLIQEDHTFFQCLKFHQALPLYSQAVHASSNTSVLALLNRSATYLELERYHLACKDAQLVVELDRRNEEVYFLMGKSFYLMRQFEKAREHFEICLKLNESNETAKIELEKPKKRRRNKNRFI